MAAHTITRAAIYARVSTTNHGQDVSVQTRELRDYCERRGWNIVGEYVDTGISGANDRRPELDRLTNVCTGAQFHECTASTNSPPNASSLEIL